MQQLIRFENRNNNQTIVPRPKEEENKSSELIHRTVLQLLQNQSHRIHISSPIAIQAPPAPTPNATPKPKPYPTKSLLSPSLYHFCLRPLAFPTAGRHSSR